MTALHGADYAVMPDRIEAGTYAIAAAIAGGEVELVGARRDTIAALLELLEQTGAEVRDTQSRHRAACAMAAGPRRWIVTTAPFPGFPTDLQAQFMALMTVAEGTSVIRETIFENRFMHVPELGRLGADIRVDGDVAIVRGVEKLKGAPVMATDLRASVSLVLAGLVAEGETIVNRVYHLDRGFDRLEEKLSGVGADIARDTGMSKTLKLAAADTEDLEMLSARLQDAAGKLKDFVWLPKQRRFAAVLNRYPLGRRQGPGHPRARRRCISTACSKVQSPERQTRRARRGGLAAGDQLHAETARRRSRRRDRTGAGRRRHHPPDGGMHRRRTGRSDRPLDGARPPQP